VGNGDAMIAEKVEKLKCYVKQDNDKRVPIVLEGVKYIPDLWINLFSICKALKGGSRIGNVHEIITLTKNDVDFKFDTQVSIYMLTIVLLKAQALEKKSLGSYCRSFLPILLKLFIEKKG
jgi:hypothetical protein